MEDRLQLGGNIDLSGFREVDSGSMVILKKIIGNYAKHFSEICDNFQSLSLTMKPIHADSKAKKFEMHCQVIDNGTVYTGEHVDHNIFFVADRVCKKVKNEMRR